MSFRAISMPMLVGLLLCGCGSAEDSAADKTEPVPVEDSVFGDMVGTMDKARAVEDTTMQRKQDLDRALDGGETDASR